MRFLVFLFGAQKLGYEHMDKQYFLLLLIVVFSSYLTGMWQDQCNPHRQASGLSGANPSMNDRIGPFVIYAVLNYTDEISRPQNPIGAIAGAS